MRQLHPSVLVATLTLLLTASAVSAADDPFAGDYRSQTLRVELIPKAGGGYSGTITLGAKQFPMAASTEGAQLLGSFTSDGKSFNFIATRDGELLTLRSGATTYVLNRVNGANRNPPAAAQAPAGVVRLTRADILDPMAGNKTAITMLMPSDWKLDGGIVWRWNAYYPTAVNARIFNPRGPEQVSCYPSLVFTDGVREMIWQSAIIAGPDAAQAAIANYPEGGNYMGFEIRKRMTDPAEALQAYALPRYRKDLARLRPVEVADMPEVAKAAAVQFNHIPGAQVRAARIRFEYQVEGKPVEEEFRCTLASAPSVANLVNWGLEIQSFRAAKGKLAEKMPLYQAMTCSASVNLKWFAEVQSVQKMMIDAGNQAIADAAMLSRYIARRNDEVTQIIRDTYRTQQASQDRVHDAWSQYIRGVERYKDPADGRPLELPSGYNHAYISPRGEVILSNDPNFNPGVTFHEDWKELPKAR